MDGERWGWGGRLWTKNEGNCEGGSEGDGVNFQGLNFFAVMCPRHASPGSNILRRFSCAYLHSNV